MRSWKRPVCLFTAVILILAGLGLTAIALIVLAWPVTSLPAGRRGNWLVGTPYLIAAVALFAGAGFVLRSIGRSAAEARDQPETHSSPHDG